MTCEAQPNDEWLISMRYINSCKTAQWPYRYACVFINAVVLLYGYSEHRFRNNGILIVLHL